MLFRSATEKSLPSVEEQLDPEAAADIKDAVTAAREACDAEEQDTKKLQGLRDELERATMPLAALLMDGVARSALSGKQLSDF